MTSRATLARTSRTRFPFTFPFRLWTTDSATYSLGMTSTFTPRCSIAFFVAGPIAATRRPRAKAPELLSLERGPEGPLFHVDLGHVDLGLVDSVLVDLPIAFSIR